jgi:hypothetical protein
MNSSKTSGSQSIIYQLLFSATGYLYLDLYKNNDQYVKGSLLEERRKGAKQSVQKKSCLKKQL